MTWLMATVAGFRHRWRWLRLLGVVAVAWVIASSALAFDGLVTAQESEPGENAARARQDAPPGCYRAPGAGNVPVCPSVSISASPNPITRGQSTTLSWKSSNTVRRSINQGIGSVGTSGSRSVSPSRNTTYTITGYSPAGSHTASVTVTVDLPNPPEPQGFSASAVDETQVKLSWNSRSGISKYEVAGHSNNIPGTSYTVTGLTKCTTRVFKVRAHGDGTTYKATWGSQALVQGSTVCPLPPAPQGFSASADGSTRINLSWNSRSGVTIYQVQDQSSSIKGTSYAVSGLTKCKDYSFKLRGHGDGTTYARQWGPWVTASAKTAGCPTVTGSLTADATTINRGQSTTLRWTTTNATSVSIDQGVGTVAASGSRGVSPSSNTTYTLTAQGPGGPVTSSVTIKVVDPKTVTGSLSADATTINRGQSTTLRWTTTNATGVSIDQGIGTVTASGSRSVTPSRTTKYTLSAQGPGGPVKASVTITVRGVTPPPPPALVVTTPTPGTSPMTVQSPEAADCPARSRIPTLSFGAPVELNVTPLPQRRAALCWSPVAGANKYAVRVERFGGGGSSDFAVDLPGTDEATGQVLDLDQLVTRAGKVEGLAHHAAYQIHVWARKGASGSYMYSNPSAAIIIIDTPITVANGASQSGGPGKAKLTWDPVPGADVLKLDDASFANGAYSFRYRQADGDHTQAGWQPGTYATDQTANESDLDDKEPVNGPFTGGAITGLVQQSIYAIQLRYVKSGKPTVFAARDVYVWPSDDPADDESLVGGDDVHARIAGFPLDYRLIGSGHPKLEYRICGETFDVEGKTRKGQWVTLIKNAFDRWQAAFPTDLVTITYSSEPCADFGPLIDVMAESLRARIGQTLPGGVSISDDAKRAHIDGILGTIRTSGMIDFSDGAKVPFDVQQVINDDRSRNEILLYNDGGGSDLSFLRAHGIFTGLSIHLFDGIPPTVTPSGNNKNPFSKIIGHEHPCWFHADGRPHDGALMCTRTDKSYDSPPTRLLGATSDIFIRRSKFTGMSLDVPRSAARANRCLSDGDDGNSAYRSMLHEIGHALGIGGSEIDDTGAGWNDRSHPPTNRPDSVMNYFDEPDCAPYPLDVMAIYALYQSR